MSLDASIPSVTYIPIVIGLAVGAGIAFWTIWRELDPKRLERRPGLAVMKNEQKSKSGRPGLGTQEYRQGAFRSLAAAYLVITVLCFAVAMIDGGAAFVVLTAVNVVIGLVSVYISRWRQDAP